jgi:hypothetical protein
MALDCGSNLALLDAIFTSAPLGLAFIDRDLSGPRQAKKDAEGRRVRVGAFRPLSANEPHTIEAEIASLTIGDKSTGGVSACHRVVTNFDEASLIGLVGALWRPRRTTAGASALFSSEIRGLR